MPSTIPQRRPIRRPPGRLAAGVAVAGFLAASHGAVGQSLDPAPGDLRGTSDSTFTPATVYTPADQFRSSPPAADASPANGPGVDPGTAPSGEAAADESPRRTYRQEPKPPGIARPVKPVKQYGPKKTILRDPLPPLKPYRTAIRSRGGAIVVPLGANAPLRGAVPTDAPLVPTPLALPQPGPTIAAIPSLERPRKLPVDPAPYAPVGIGVGSLRLIPYIETDGGYDSNPDQTTKAFAKPSAFAHVDGGASIQSDWSRHSLSAELHGGYYDYFSNSGANRPDASGTATGRIDVTRDTFIDTVGRFNIGTQRPGSPEVAFGQVSNDVDNRPLTYTYGGDTGVTHKFGRLAVSLKGSFDRIGYEDATLSDGSVIPLSRDNYNQYGAKARLAYELTPSVTPFGEGYGNIRRHDTLLDTGGVNRNSTGEGARVGSTFDLGRKLVGEVAVGYEHRDYVSKTLRPLQAPLVDGSLVYSATPLTTVALKATSELDETNIPGSSGAVGRRVSLEVSHALFRNLTITGLLAYSNLDYQGIKLSENTYDMGLKADYSLSRSVVVRGSFTHERLQSGVPGLDYTQNVFLLGLRLQR